MQKTLNQTASFQHARKQRSQEVLEDYVELIAEAKEGIRVCDLAAKLGISHVSVLKTVKKLVKDGYLKRDDSPFIQLTAKGKKAASFSKKKHLVLFSFLLKIGVPKEIAAFDVEGIEHHISPKTLEMLEAHLEQIS